MLVIQDVNKAKLDSRSFSGSVTTKESLIKSSMNRIAGKIVMIARSATKVVAILLFYDAEERDTVSA